MAVSNDDIRRVAKEQADKDDDMAKILKEATAFIKQEKAKPAKKPDKS